MKRSTHTVQHKVDAGGFFCIGYHVSGCMLALALAKIQGFMISGGYFSAWRHLHRRRRMSAGHGVSGEGQTLDGAYDPESATPWWEEWEDAEGDSRKRKQEAEAAAAQANADFPYPYLNNK